MSYQTLLSTMNTVADLSAASSVLGWDQETYMPEGAVQARAEHLATLSGLAHRFMTEDSVHRAVESSETWMPELSERERRIAEVFIRDFRRAAQLPADLVEQLARTAALAQDAWKRARASSDFTVFQPLLEQTVELKKRQAEVLGGGVHLYDTLLDEFEPGMTVDVLTPVFENLRKATSTLLRDLAPYRTRVSDDVLYRHYDESSQLAFASKVVEDLGFNMRNGRVDLTAHPFCTSFAITDVRLTTRIRPQDLRSCLFGLIHEAGHGMYEQGVSPVYARTSGAGGTSMGIHESQSLFWENMVARSRPFWEWCFPQLRTAFPDQLADISADSFYRAINRIEPSLNRVESDEVTYNLHIILRFEIERDLMNGTLSVADIPSRWNDTMLSSLGIASSNDAEGCLQDIHWSFGGIGYFPSYTLGKLYAAMFWSAIQRDVPHVEELIARGEFAPIVSWLNRNIHECGRTQQPDEIVQRVTGRSLTETDFVHHIQAKAAAVYGI